MDTGSWTDDEYLIGEFRGGNMVAFKHVYMMHERLLWGLARKILQSEEAAEDVVAEAFLKLWNRRESFTTAATFRPWLISVVRNACFDILKQRKRNEAMLKNIVGMTDIQENEYADALDVYTGLLAKIIDQMPKMPPSMRQIFKMTFFEGMTPAEIAKELSISEDTVRVQKSRALKLVKRFLRPEDFISLILFHILFHS